MSSEASVFISWSGERSQSVAEKLRSWLPYVIESPSYWLSSRDLQDGRRWATELAERLEVSHFGILVVTPENSSSPWLLFEAGALSKGIQAGRVLPYLVAIKKAALEGPLSQFQALVANKEGTRRLVESIRTALPTSPEKAVIQKRFDMFWPELASELADIIERPMPNSSEGSPSQEEQNDIAVLRGELAETTTLIRQLVSSLTSPAAASNKPIRELAGTDLHLLEGPWLGEEEGTHLYARVIDGQLVAPYCYGGNDELTAEYYDWKKVGDYWFTRYRWFDRSISGFAFYKLETSDKLVGMWWYRDDAPNEMSTFEDLDGKVRSRGHQAVWIRKRKLRPPKWVQEYFQKAEEGALRKKKTQ